MTIISEYACCDAFDLAALVRRKEVSPPELLETAIQVIDTVAPSGHRGIFRINPWRRSEQGKCVPDNGGCSRTLGPEAQENIALATTIEQGAGATFSVTVPAHSAALVTLTRAEGNDRSAAETSP